MSAKVAAIRDNVKGVLTSASLTPALEPVTIYDLAFDLADLQGGRLSIVPQTKDVTLLDRKGSQRQEVKIDVAVQFKYTQPTSSEIDPYLGLAEVIPDQFIGKVFDLTGFYVTCTEASFPHGLFLARHIEEFGVFTSVVTLTFVVSE